MECENNSNNYVNDDATNTTLEDIIFVDSSGNQIHVDENTNLSINIGNITCDK